MPRFVRGCLWPCCAVPRRRRRRFWWSLAWPVIIAGLIIGVVPARGHTAGGVLIDPFTQLTTTTTTSTTTSTTTTLWDPTVVPPDTVGQPPVWVVDFSAKASLSAYTAPRPAERVDRINPTDTDRDNDGNPFSLTRGQLSHRCDPGNPTERDRGCLTDTEIREWVVGAYDWPQPDLPVRVLVCESGGRAFLGWGGGNGLFQLTGGVRERVEAAGVDYDLARGRTPEAGLEVTVRAAAAAVWAVTRGGHPDRAHWGDWHGGVWPATKERPKGWTQSYWGGGPGGSGCWNYG